MATPPFQVEDQTDADFFDKLVDDDFGISESSTKDVELDEAKALANLNIGDVNTVMDDSGDAGFSSEGEERSKNDILQSVETQVKDVSTAEESVSLVSANSFEFDTVNKSADAVPTRGVAFDSTASKNSGSKGTSIKEVEWTAFNADTAEQDAGGFGSYSDFFTGLENNSADPFASIGDTPNADMNSSTIVQKPVADLKMSFSSSGIQDSKVCGANQDSLAYGTFMEQNPDGHDMNSIQYWENLYPGWKYDSATGQWYQVDGFDAAGNTQEAFQDKAQSAGQDIVSNQISEISYFQQTSQSFVGNVAQSSATGSVSNWNQASQGSTEYPVNMVFDPQYPGWFYDTITQQWYTLESYTSSGQTRNIADDQQTQDENTSSGGLTSYSQNQYESQNQDGQGQGGYSDQSASSYTQQNLWQPEPVAQSETVASLFGNEKTGNLYASGEHLNTYKDQQVGFKAKENVPLYGQANQNYNSSNGVTGFQSFASMDNLSQFHQGNVESKHQRRFSYDFQENQKSLNFSQQQFQMTNTSCSHSYAPTEEMSSAGRPPHALVTFGFGGKLIVMKDISSFGAGSGFGSQDPVGGSISILNLVEVVNEKRVAATNACGALSYFDALCQQSFPGPLVGGNVGTKELTKWIDERIVNCESTEMDLRKAELLRLLFSLLKISCQHYGKLRSPFGVDPTVQETDGPESAVTKLFASAKRNGGQLSEYGAFTHCMQNLPSEGQIRATAVEVQNLLVSGRRKEALQCAQEGQLWGPALLLAAQLSEQFYVDTVKQMAHRQFVSGSPLRTLCLLIAGQPEDVFSADSYISSGLAGAVNTPQQLTQIRPNGMLDDWEENLAIITANRTKNDELVIIHLGDCLWKDRGEITAAHTCYLVAEANFEAYSDTARLCLVGADHWKYPRTYASPEAIQRTELYEYSKVLGNSQYILLPFQPYKIIYAYMLAEVGRVSDSLRYCQAISKALKVSSRAPEVDSWKLLLSSLEERIRTHQQGGYSSNLAPAKLVGKLFTSIDRSIHRMIGAPPPPTPATSQSSFQVNEHDNHPVAPKVANSQSTMAMSSLMPSASMEPISDWTGDGSRMSVHNRSISEPDFANPKQVDASKEAEARGKSSIAGGSSRFGRFGSQLLQKTMGWVSKSRTDRQAKLGETNKFYYDEKLKRWVEEGAELPAEEVALPPPPTVASFQNGTSDYSINSALKTQNLPANGGPQAQSPDLLEHSSALEHSSGIPPIPPSTNQFSARGRMGVRSRYVDTFNKGGGTPTNLFQSPSVPAAKPVAAAKFFVPIPAASSNQTVDSIGEGTQEAASNEEPSTSVMKDLSFSSTSSSSSPSIMASSSSIMQRFPSMDNINHPAGNKGMGLSKGGDGAFATRSRAASWSGSSSTEMFNSKPPGEALGMPHSTFMPGNPSPLRPNRSGSFGDDLHEVEL